MTVFEISWLCCFFWYGASRNVNVFKKNVSRKDELLVSFHGF